MSAKTLITCLHKVHGICKTHNLFLIFFINYQSVVFTSINVQTENQINSTYRGGGMTGEGEDIICRSVTYYAIKTVNPCYILNCLYQRLQITFRVYQLPVLVYEGGGRGYTINFREIYPNFKKIFPLLPHTSGLYFIDGPTIKLFGLDLYCFK